MTGIYSSDRMEEDFFVNSDSAEDDAIIETLDSLTEELETQRQMIEVLIERDIENKAKIDALIEVLSDIKNIVDIKELQVIIKDNEDSEYAKLQFGDINAGFPNQD